MPHRAFTQNIRYLIAQEQIDKALHLMADFFDNSPHFKEVVHQTGRYKALTRQLRLGIVDPEFAQVTQNQIRLALLDLLDEMEKTVSPHSSRPDAQALRQEMQRAVTIVNSKNVLTGNLTVTGGNVYIGDNIQVGVKQEVPKPTQSLNEQLTHQLIEAIRPYNSYAGKFFNHYSGKAGWYKNEKIGNEAKQIIASAWVGAIGIQLSKLIAIGKQGFAPDNLHRYVEKCRFIMDRCLDLVNFALLSHLWDCLQQKPLLLPEDLKMAMDKRLNTTFELETTDHLALLRTLYLFYTRHDSGFTLPLPELSTLDALLEPGSELDRVGTTLHGLGAKSNIAPEEAYQAEELLGRFLTHFAFLANYQMASIKRITFKQIRSVDPRYIHNYVALGIDSKANVDAEKINFTIHAADTEAVLLYKGDHYRDAVNLFPFIIDYNTLTFEHGAKICFFQSQTMDGEELKYLFLEDGSTQCLAHKSIGTNFNELLLDDNNRKILNLNSVVEHLRQACHCLTANLAS